MYRIEPISYLRLFAPRCRTSGVAATTVLLLSLTLLACSSDDESAASGATSGTSGDDVNGTDTGANGGGVTMLGPLPSPPLTEPPSADDEPIPEGAEFTTASGFAVVRDPQAFPRAEEVAPALTEADFAAGLPEPEIEQPVGIDPATNGAPFFADLANVRVSAGEPVAIRFEPRDPEGELPGIFPLQLPVEATFDDNFDGTKTLNWIPLEADVGITAFTVVAIDPTEPDYRTSQTVLIAVDEATNPAAVPNVAPSITEVPEYVVRAGDPVVIEIEGTDRNGTVPTLELPTPPPGATLLQRPLEPERFVLRFVPETVGVIEVDVLSRDAIDANLASTESVVLDVRPATEFVRPGERLRTLAEGRGIQFGSAISPFFHRQADGALYQSIAAEEFGVLTPESSMKMDAINPAPGHYAFADTDNLIAFARASGMVVRGHPLVWYRQLPPWVEATPEAEREGHMREFIARIVERYADDVSIWDVVNEPVEDDGSLRASIWSEAMGEDYIDIAFRQARALAPTATLVLNEFDTAFAGPKFDGLLALLDRMIERDVPIDAVGFQMHLFASFDQFDELTANMAAIAERGLDVHITELDVALTETTNEATQAAVYQRVAETCLAQPRCTTMQTWGFTDRYSFRTLFDPLLLDRAYQAKPGYGALQGALGG